MTDERITLGDAARKLNIPYHTVHAAWRNGRFSYRRAGSAILVRLEDVKVAFRNYRPRGIAEPKARVRSH